MYDVLYQVKDKETGEVIEEEHFEWPEAVYKMVLHQQRVAKEKLKRGLGMFGFKGK
jgi:hypothetical protein